ncbi:hypothetical protein ACFYXL_22420 [Streptomyces tsukubensis]|uniref:hypothetical protein n=1 Tax=Streptomyces tsukubensis TaxID=83656 RepID=UPI0036756C4E
MPFTDPSAWDDHLDECPLCQSADRDDPALLRCAVHTLLQDGVFMTHNEIPLVEIVSRGTDYLRDLAASPGGDHTTPVPDARLAAWMDAEVRLALARAAGLPPAGALDPRIGRILTDAATWPEKQRADLFERAADLFALKHTPAPERRLHHR